jgi:hypothetical protein
MKPSYDFNKNLGVAAHVPRGDRDYSGPQSWSEKDGKVRLPPAPKYPRFYRNGATCSVCSKPSIGYTNDRNGNQVFVHSSHPDTGAPRMCRRAR